MNRKNLEKLEKYLRGKLEAKFSMDRFCTDKYGLNKPDSVTCGSTGCAVGHGPYAGIDKRCSENWMEYACRVFDLKSLELDWCFGPDWARRNNLPTQAAHRIRRLLDEGVPEGFRENPEAYYVVTLI